MADSNKFIGKFEKRNGSEVFGVEPPKPDMSWVTRVPDQAEFEEAAQRLGRMGAQQLKNAAAAGNLAVDAVLADIQTVIVYGRIRP